MSQFQLGDGTYPEHLLEKNQRNTPENISLFKSSKAGSLTGVRNALNNGAKPNYFYNPEDSKNSLHVAAEGGYLDIVKELLDHGAYIESIVTGSKETALLLAARQLHIDVVKYLLESGANISAANSYGNTALHEAIRENSLELSDLLLKYNANVNYANHKGSTPLHFLCYQTHDHRENDRMLIRQLIQHGANIHLRDNRGMTPFLVCCSSGRVDLIDILLEEGADPTVVDNNHHNAYKIAEFYNHTNIMERFANDTPTSRFSFK